MKLRCVMCCTLCIDEKYPGRKKKDKKKAKKRKMIVIKKIQINRKRIKRRMTKRRKKNIKSGQGKQQLNFVQYVKLCCVSTAMIPFMIIQN